MDAEKVLSILRAACQAIEASYRSDKNDMVWATRELCQYQVSKQEVVEVVSRSLLEIHRELSG